MSPPLFSVEFTKFFSSKSPVHDLMNAPEEEDLAGERTVAFYSITRYPITKSVPDP